MSVGLWEILFAVGYIVMCVGMWFVAPNVRWRRASREPECVECGYALGGLMASGECAVGRCPECGWVIDVGLAERAPRLKRPRRVLVGAVLMLVGFLVPALVFPASLVVKHGPVPVAWGLVDLEPDFVWGLAVRLGELEEGGVDASERDEYRRIVLGAVRRLDEATERGGDESPVALATSVLMLWDGDAASLRAMGLSGEERWLLARVAMGYGVESRGVVAGDGAVYVRIEPGRWSWWSGGSAGSTPLGSASAGLEEGFEDGVVGAEIGGREAAFSVVRRAGEGVGSLGDGMWVRLEIPEGVDVDAAGDVVKGAVRIESSGLARVFGVEELVGGELGFSAEVVGASGVLRPVVDEAIDDSVRRWVEQGTLTVESVAGAEDGAVRVVGRMRGDAYVPMGGGVPTGVEVDAEVEVSIDGVFLGEGRAMWETGRGTGELVVPRGERGAEEGDGEEGVVVGVDWVRSMRGSGATATVRVVSDLSTQPWRFGDVSALWDGEVVVEGVPVRWSVIGLD